MSVPHLRPLRPLARRAAHERRPRGVSRRRSSTCSTSSCSPPASSRGTTSRCARRNTCPSTSSCCAARCRTRSRSASTAFASSPRSRHGQKTGAFLDQRENRALDRRASPAAARSTASAITARSRCTSRDAPTPSSRSTSRPPRSSEPRVHAALNGITNVELVEADAFDYLTRTSAAGARFDTIVLDPPAFAKTRASLPAAIRGYKDINLRALRLLSQNGLLFTASCSFHLTKPLFLEMLQDAAADSGRRVVLRAITTPARRSSGDRDDSGNGILEGRAVGGSVAGSGFSGAMALPANDAGTSGSSTSIDPPA